jgi:hypothetical protein
MLPNPFLVQYKRLSGVLMILSGRWEAQLSSSFEIRSTACMSSAPWSSPETARELVSSILEKIKLTVTECAIKESGGALCIGPDALLLAIRLSVGGAVNESLKNFLSAIGSGTLWNGIIFGSRTPVDDQVSVSYIAHHTNTSISCDSTM